MAAGKAQGSASAQTFVELLVITSVAHVEMSFFKLFIFAVVGVVPNVFGGDHGRQQDVDKEGSELHVVVFVVPFSLFF